MSYEMLKWDSKTIIWGDLGEDFWLPYSKLSYSQRCNFLLQYNLQHRDVPTCRKCKAVMLQRSLHRKHALTPHVPRYGTHSLTPHMSRYV